MKNWFTALFVCFCLAFAVGGLVDLLIDFYFPPTQIHALETGIVEVSSSKVTSSDKTLKHRHFKISMPWEKSTLEKRELRNNDVYDAWEKATFIEIVGAWEKPTTKFYVHKERRPHVFKALKAAEEDKELKEWGKYFDAPRNLPKDVEEELVFNIMGEYSKKIPKYQINYQETDFGLEIISFYRKP